MEVKTGFVGEGHIRYRRGPKDRENVSYVHSGFDAVHSESETGWGQLGKPNTASATRTKSQFTHKLVPHKLTKPTHND